MNTPETNSNLANERLKAAVKSVEVPPFLETKIRSRIRAEQQPRFGFVLKSAVAGAALAGVLALGTAYRLGDLRVTAGSQESYIATISAQVAALMQVGLGDHVHCAFFRKYPQAPPPVEEIESALGPEYRDVAEVVERHVPREYRLVMGHTCRYHQRRFVHLILKGDSRLLSLVLTEKRAGESFDSEGLLPELVHQGIPLYQSGVQRFQIAAMETPGHLVYFISDLPAGDNRELMQAMAPELQRLLANLEG